MKEANWDICQLASYHHIAYTSALAAYMYAASAEICN